MACPLVGASLSAGVFSGLFVKNQTLQAILLTMFIRWSWVGYLISNKGSTIDAVTNGVDDGLWKTINMVILVPIAKDWTVSADVGLTYTYKLVRELNGILQTVKSMQK